MSQTTTALGTVPQTIVSLVGADLIDQAAYSSVSEFDTHGSERIAFQVSATRGAYTALDVVFQVRDAEDSTYYDAPTSLSRVHFDPGSTAVDEAFTIQLGRNIDKVRILYKTDGGGNEVTGSLVIKGMLTAPTYPIMGGTL
jgi:hypothetical protein